MDDLFISVQGEDFSVAAAYETLSKSDDMGAIAVFVGKVRQTNLETPIQSLTLEHYPKMTQKVLTDICVEAKQRWTLGGIYLVHRVGTLAVGEQIVCVGVASPHRQSAFDACEFIMDLLKTQAPFWKKEQTPQGERWLSMRQSDQDAAQQWFVE